MGVIARPFSELDPDLAAVPQRYFPHCIQCGIVPAMKTDGKKTYWGADIDDEVDDKTKTLFGKGIGLHTEGDNTDKTRARKEAIEIIQDPD